jgi:hypothetical protein
MRRERADLEGNDLIPLVIQALCAYGPTPINPMNPVNPIKVGSPGDTEIQFLTVDIPAMIKALAQAQENGPDLETISPKRAGQVCGRMRLPEVPLPSGKVQSGGKHLRVSAYEQQRGCCASGWSPTVWRYSMNAKILLSHPPHLMGFMGLTGLMGVWEHRVMGLHLRSLLRLGTCAPNVGSL